MCKNLLKLPLMNSVAVSGQRPLFNKLKCNNQSAYNCLARIHDAC